MNGNHLRPGEIIDPRLRNHELMCHGCNDHLTPDDESDWYLAVRWNPEKGFSEIIVAYCAMCMRGWAGLDRRRAGD